jgi:hypothetical protein
MFWSRWVKEYLPSLIQRSEWFFEQRNIKKGDIVLCVEDNIDIHSWPLGRVIEVLPSEDGRIITIRVKNKYGTYIRRPTPGP